MLAETCNNIGKLANENPPLSQDSNLPISPSCSSSCSAPKFSPHSVDCSPVDHSKFTDDSLKDKTNKDKSKKRKAIKKDPLELLEKRMPTEHHGLTSSPYTISEFLKMNSFTPSTFSKPDVNPLMYPFYHNIMSQNLQTSSVWKSRPPLHPRMPFPVNYQNANYAMHPTIPAQMFRGPPNNLMQELNHIYTSSCDCVICCHKKNMEKSVIKMDPLFFNSMHCQRLARPMLPQPFPLMTATHVPVTGNGSSTIRYCMYCGYYIPQIQNLLNHIQSEHIDQICSTFQPKLEPVGNFNFSLENWQSKEVKSREILKQLHMLYNGEHGDESCVDKTLLMR